MLKPVALQKIYLIGLKSAQAQALRLWQKMGVIHIAPLPVQSLGLSGGQPLADYAKISQQLVRIRAILSQLEKTPVRPEPLPGNLLETAQSVQIDAELLGMKEDEDNLAKQADTWAASEKALRRLSNFELDFGALPSNLRYQLVVLGANEKESAAALNHLKRALKHSQILTAQDGLDPKSTIALLAVPPSQDMSSALQDAEKMEWPSLGGTPAQAVLRAQGELASIREGLKAVSRRRHDLSLEYYPLCARLEEALSIASDLARVSSGMGESSGCFFASGWVHPHKLPHLEHETRQAFGRQVIIKRAHMSADHPDPAQPTLLENPRVAAPAQFLVEFLSIPRANEIDPTLITFFTIPLLYGMIVGDAGYALISLLLAALIRFKSAKGGLLYNFAGLWMLGAIPTLIFGVLFDEYFGYGHAHLLGYKMYDAVVHRVENVQLLLLLTIITGWIHVAFGFVLGALNEWPHSKKHAIAKLSWLPIQLGGTLAVAYYLLHAVSPEVGMVGAALMVVGMGILAWAEGPLGLVEVPGLASNIMSYARIAAVGVAGVILAEAINKMVSPNPELLSSPAGILTFIIIAIVYVLLHVVNTFIAMFEGVIHGARLNVVEFFGKFFHGGGMPFRPLAEKRRFSV